MRSRNYIAYSEPNGKNRFDIGNGWKHQKGYQGSRKRKTLSEQTYSKASNKHPKGCECAFKCDPAFFRSSITNNIIDPDTGKSMHFSKLVAHSKSKYLKKVINMKDSPVSGFKLVDRSTKWGNPFYLKSDSNEERIKVVSQYKKWVLTKFGIETIRKELAGFDLACWCSPKLCHANVLLSIVQKGT